MKMDKAKYGKPFLLIRWLPNDDHCRDTYNALSLHGSELIDTIDAETENDIINALKTCIDKGVYPQYIYISSHAGRTGVSRDRECIKSLSWDCLANEFSQFKLPIVLWLGSCNSHNSIRSFSTRCDQKNVKLIVCFFGAINPSAVQEFLLKMIKNTDAENIIYFDEEVELMRDFLSKQLSDDASIHFYYHVKYCGGNAYLNADDFNIEFGMSFLEYLNKICKLPKNSILGEAIALIDKNIES